MGVGEAKGKPPHVTGADFLKLYNIAPGSPEAYALTYEDFTALARGLWPHGRARSGRHRDQSDPR